MGHHNIKINFILLFVYLFIIITIIGINGEIFMIDEETKKIEEA